MEFKTPSQLDINSEEELEISSFWEADKLLRVNWKSLRFGFSKNDEEIADLYFFVEENGKFIQSEGDLVLYKLDGINFTLIDLDETLVVIVREHDIEEIEQML